MLDIFQCLKVSSKIVTKSDSSQNKSSRLKVFCQKVLLKLLQSHRKISLLESLYLKGCIGLRPRDSVTGPVNFGKFKNFNFVERLQTDASVKDDSSQKQPTLELFWEIYLLRTFQKLQEKHHDSVYFFVKLLCLITFIKTFLKLFSCEILKGCFYPLDVPRIKWRLIAIFPFRNIFAICALFWIEQKPKLFYR